MDSSQTHSLAALLVFENTINKELIRSLHVYRLEDGTESKVEREFVFKNEGSYVEMEANPLLTLQRFHFKDVFQGQVFGSWVCILAFRPGFPRKSGPVPPILSISRNRKLKSIALLANDLKTVYRLNSRMEDELSRLPSEEMREVNSHRAKNCLPDLNCLPTTELTDQQQLDQTAQVANTGVKDGKKKRAAAEDIAKISLDDLIKYFDLPIAEASRNLNVGLTVLKRKCREFGIPRWPHRKIKSLGSLITNLQEEVARRQKLEDMAAVTAVEKRQSMLQKEKESIEREPFMELQTETKKFRQDIFKRRHRARALKNNEDMTQLTIS